MNYQIKLWDKSGKYIEQKMRYSGYSRREAVRDFREKNGLVGKRLGDRLCVEKMGALV